MLVIGDPLELLSDSSMVVGSYLGREEASGRKGKKKKKKKKKKEKRSVLCERER